MSRAGQEGTIERDERGWEVRKLDGRVVYPFLDIFPHGTPPEKILRTFQDWMLVWPEQYEDQKEWADRALEHTRRAIRAKNPNA